MYLTAVNAISDVNIIADKPSAAANTWTSAPVHTPKLDAIPIFFPCAIVLPRMYIKSGPGDKLIAKAADKKRTQNDKSDIL